MEGSLWTVITGTLSGRRGSALSFAGVADEGNSGGPVRFKGKVVGIVTEVGTKFNSAAPAVVARFVLEGWGVRLSEEGKEPPLDMVPEEREPVAVQSMARAMVAGKYQGLGFSTMGGMVGLQATYQQSGETVSGSYINNQGDFGPMQGQVRDKLFEWRAVSGCLLRLRLGRGCRRQNDSGLSDLQQRQLGLLRAGTAGDTRGSAMPPPFDHASVLRTAFVTAGFWMLASFLPPHIFEGSTSKNSKVAW
jgi:hypothetical protein